MLTVTVVEKPAGFRLNSQKDADPARQRGDCAVNQAGGIVPGLAGVANVASSPRGSVFGRKYSGPGFRVRNGHDPEGNIRKSGKH
jgi:hypothetical protein